MVLKTIVPLTFDSDEGISCSFSSSRVHEDKRLGHKSRPLNVPSCGQAIHLTARFLKRDPSTCSIKAGLRVFLTDVAHVEREPHRPSHSFDDVGATFRPSRVGKDITTS